MLDALPAGEQVQAQTPTAQARQFLAQSPVGAQALNTVTSSVELGSGMSKDMSIEQLDELEAEQRVDRHQAAAADASAGHAQ